MSDSIEETVTEEPVAEPQMPSIEERELALKLKENGLAAKDEFKKFGIPDSLLDFVVDQDVEVQKQRIEKLSAAWKDSVKSAVKTRVGAEPPPNTGNRMPMKPFAQLSYRERLELKKTSPELYAQVSRQTR